MQSSSQSLPSSSCPGLLAVLTNRLSRIVDRARLLESNFSSIAEPDQVAVNKELATLSHRAQLINRSISLATTCALLICAVISWPLCLFSSSVFSVSSARSISQSAISGSACLPRHPQKLRLNKRMKQSSASKCTEGFPRLR